MKSQNTEFIGKLGMSPEAEKEMLEACDKLPKLVLKAQWDVSYWKSGSGFSHTETVNHTEENEVLTPEEMKQSLKGWWYDEGWSDDEYDGHYWKVTYFNGEEHFDEEECWIYPEDFE